jgi:hypothetical protein
MKKYRNVSLILLCLPVLLFTSFYWEGPQEGCPFDRPEWGFFGHKRINRMATLTLPPEMMVFFKPNIDYLTDHAADPDMRRYAVNWEAPRHYIDLDEYGGTLGQLPRTWLEALMTYAKIKGLNAAGDTMAVYSGTAGYSEKQLDNWKSYFAKEVLYRFSSDDKSLNADSLNSFVQRNGFAFPALQSVFFTESLSAHGILPWNLQQMHKRLTKAFRDRDSRLILKLCADIGHYVGDAHVPLHTTSNYNGQKSNQYGIHGFWESRIPELFADEQYDYFIGKPEYIEYPTDYFWKVVTDSHLLVDSVLHVEWALRSAIPADQQMCPDLRQGSQVLTQCRDFAAAYQQNMRGMVERRMRTAVHAVSSVWYSAWLDAGAPDLSHLDGPMASDTDRKEEEELLKGFRGGKIIGRPEEN